MLNIARRITSLFVICFLAVAVAASALTTRTQPCQDAIPLGLEALREMQGLEGFESRIFKIFVAEPGRLLLDVAPVTADSVEPRIGSFGRICEHTAEGQAALESYLTGGVVAIDQPGHYFFRVAAQDPSAPPADYVLRSRFAVSSQDAVSYKNIEEPEEAPDLIPTKDIEEPEEAPDLFIATLPETSTGLCPNLKSHDQGDVFTCASPIAPRRDVEGEIRHHQTRDVDVFAFALTDFRTVEIVATAENPIAIALHDRQGHRLAVLEPAASLRTTRTLGPGRYFLRVSGDQETEGLYRLRLETSAW